MPPTLGSSAVNVLVVYAHPDPESFGADLRDAAVRGLRTGGHEVTVLDLEAERYEPCLTLADYEAYDKIGQLDGDGHHDPVVQRHIAAVRAADVLTFIYPTFWSGLPAMLKGWIDRTMLPGVSFSVKPGGGVRGELGHVQRVIGVTTYGSPRSYRWIVGDGGRRTLRLLRRSAKLRCRFQWLALDTLDGRSNDERRAFLAHVESTLAEL